MTAIETARLRLRRFAIADTAAYAAIRAQPEIARWLPSFGKPDEDWPALALRVIAHFDDCWRRQGYGPWAATDRATGRLLGHLGLRHVPEFDEVELLWALDRGIWGRGLATEGALAARDFAFERLDLARVIAFTLPGNAASRRVMEKAGLRLERPALYKGHEVVLYALERAEWRRLVRPASYRPAGEGSPGRIGSAGEEH